MTDKELAKEYVDKLYAEKVSKEDYDKDGRILYRSEDISDAFLAGQKAGRLKWRDLRKDPNDLPRQDETFTTKISIPVMTHPSYQFAEYYFDEKKWFSRGEEVNVIAWCEIPLYKEK